MTYSNEAKNDLLGVPDELLMRVGAVSEEVARAMAAGALERSDAHLAVAVTGIAGPGGGTSNQAGGPGASCLRGAGRQGVPPAGGLCGRSRRGAPRHRRDRARHADRRCRAEDIAPWRQPRRPSPHKARNAILAHARTLGFQAVGIASAEGAPSDAANLKTFIGLGYAGDMAWLARTAGRRADPRTLWPEARSVVAVGVNYGPAHDPLRLLDEPTRGIVSAYAQGRDYHDVIKGRLRRLARFVVDTFGAEVKLFVDTAPVMEKPLAARAGLGWQGKHTNLVSREHGSWLFLGELFTTLDLAPDEGEDDHCGSCRQCLDICPTDAFPAPYRLDARRCISYLTIEHKGHIAPDYREAMGNRIYGCDDCLAVCPWNKFARRTEEYAFLPRPELTAATARRPRGAGRQVIQNGFFGQPGSSGSGAIASCATLLIAIGNSGDAKVWPAARRLLTDGSPLVRAMAVWASRRLASPDTFEALRTRHEPVEQEFRRAGGVAGACGGG